MKILVTGGAGYIGSHTCVELLTAGHEVIVFDDFCNSSPEAIKRVRQITGKEVPLIKGDIRDDFTLRQLFKAHTFDAVMHFAGLKAVGESCTIPLSYYENNISGTITLCQMMAEHNVNRLIFSSSATVYGDPHALPIEEDFPLSTTNPDGHSKLVVEEILREVFKSDTQWNIALLHSSEPTASAAWLAILLPPILS